MTLVFMDPVLKDSFSVGRFSVDNAEKIRGITEPEAFSSPFSGHPPRLQHTHATAPAAKLFIWASYTLHPPFYSSSSSSFVHSMHPVCRLVGRQAGTTSKDEGHNTRGDLKLNGF